jgi:four helix bundle protein
MAVFIARSRTCCMREHSMANYDLWERRLPTSVTADSIWKVTAYRRSLYARRQAWSDCLIVARHRLGEPIARQLYRSVASVAANIADGWSRTSGLDRARFFEYALSSAREAIVWYLAVTPMLRTPTRDRLSQLAEVRQLLLVMIQNERKRRGRLIKRGNGKQGSSG